MGGEVEVAVTPSVRPSGQVLHGRLAGLLAEQGGDRPSGNSPAIASTSRRVPGSRAQASPRSPAGAPRRRARRASTTAAAVFVGVESDAERARRRPRRCGPRLAPVPDRDGLRDPPAATGLRSAWRLQGRAVVLQQDVAGLDAVQVGVAVGDDASDGQAVVGRRRGCDLGLGGDRPDRPGPAAGRAGVRRSGPRNAGEHRGRRGVADDRPQARSGRAAISTSIGTPASAGEGSTTSRLTPSRCGCERLEPLPRQRRGQRASPAGSRSQLGAEGRRSIRVVFGPRPLRAGAGDAGPRPARPAAARRRPSGTAWSAGSP